MIRIDKHEQLRYMNRFCTRTLQRLVLPIELGFALDPLVRDTLLPGGSTEILQHTFDGELPANLAIRLGEDGAFHYDIDPRGSAAGGGLWRT
jgi:hypothetical protein